GQAGAGRGASIRFDDETAILGKVPAVTKRAIVIHAAAVSSLETPVEVAAMDVEVHLVLRKFACVEQNIAKPAFLPAARNATGTVGIFWRHTTTTGAGQTDQHGVRRREVEGIKRCRRVRRAQ